MASTKIVKIAWFPPSDKNKKTKRYNVWMNLNDLSVVGNVYFTNDPLPKLLSEGYKVVSSTNTIINESDAVIYVLKQTTERTLLND